MTTHHRLALSRKTVAILVKLIATTVVLVQCTSAPQPPAAAAPASVTPSAPSTPSSRAAAPAAPAPAAAIVHPVTSTDLGASWRPGCPVGPEQLRRVEVNHIGLDGRTHRGALIVNHDLVSEVIAIFEQLYELRYPIEKIRTVDRYPGADDELSMRDNNTSGFNCRGIPGTDHWSQHAYGRAIDVNPLLNPFIDSAGVFEPANAAPYLDRGRSDPGLLHNGDPAGLVFTNPGWEWGGVWRTPIDCQHFAGP